MNGVNILFLLKNKVILSTNNKCWGGYGEKRNTPTLLVRMKIGAPTMGSSMEVSQNTENRTQQFHSQVNVWEKQKH